jgi:photosystem II stability/assembly factor-like uncharacterized protein
MHRIFYITIFLFILGCHKDNPSISSPVETEQRDTLKLPEQDTVQYLQASSGDIWRRIDFPDTSTGYFWPSPGGPSTSLLKTTDGGLTWRSTKYIGYAEVLRFFNNRIGLIIQGSSSMWRTLDGGDSWELCNSPGTTWGNDIEFDPNNVSRVWMTDHKQLYFSSDTGRNWSLAVISDTGVILGRDIKFTSSLDGWLLTDGKVYRTLDGRNWSRSIGLSYQGRNGLAIDALDKNTAVVSLSNGIFRTTDGGSNWQAISVQRGDAALALQSNLNVWVSSQQKIFRTTNGGGLWIEQLNDTSKTVYINYIKFFDLQNGIAMGDPATNSPTLFIYTKDGGATWNQRLPVLKN